MGLGSCWGTTLDTIPPARQRSVRQRGSTGKFCQFAWPNGMVQAPRKLVEGIDCSRQASADFGAINNRTNFVPRKRKLRPKGKPW